MIAQVDDKTFQMAFATMQRPMYVGYNRDNETLSYSGVVIFVGFSFTAKSSADQSFRDYGWDNGRQV